MPFQNATITCFEQQIPDFVGPELDRLYGARYASLAHFAIYGGAAPPSTYVASAAGRTLSVLLYRRRGATVVVLNEGMRLGADEAACFAGQMFARYPEIGAVRFHAVELGPQRPPWPQLRVACAEDSMLALPATVAAYQKILGASTRATLNNRLNRLRRDFPSFRFTVYQQAALPPGDLAEIARLSRLSMASKVSALDAAEEARIAAYVRASGFVGVATIDGAFCAGAVTYRLGANFSARLLAHDARYDRHRLGFLCAYLMLCECIKQGGQGRFYFGWGQNDYKQHLGARPRLLSELVLYRSRWQRLRQAGPALALLWRGLLFLGRARLRRAAGGRGWLARCLRVVR